MAQDRDGPADNFKRALTLAMKTIADEPELTVSFGAETPGLTDKRARLPQASSWRSTGRFAAPPSAAGSCQQPLQPLLH